VEERIFREQAQARAFVRFAFYWAIFAFIFMSLNDYEREMRQRRHSEAMERSVTRDEFIRLYYEKTQKDEKAPANEEEKEIPSDGINPVPDTPR